MKYLWLSLWKEFCLKCRKDTDHTRQDGQRSKLFITWFPMYACMGYLCIIEMHVAGSCGGYVCSFSFRYLKGYLRAHFVGCPETSLSLLMPNSCHILSITSGFISTCHSLQKRTSDTKYDVLMAGAAVSKWGLAPSDERLCALGAGGLWSVAAAFQQVKLWGICQTGCCAMISFCSSRKYGEQVFCLKLDLRRECKLGTRPLMYFVADT